jgi:hypothetical protein
MPFNLGAILGLAIFVAGIWQAVRSKPTFSVVLTAAHGEVTAYRSKNREFDAQSTLLAYRFEAIALLSA